MEMQQTLRLFDDPPLCRACAVISQFGEIERAAEAHTGDKVEESREEHLHRHLDRACQLLPFEFLASQLQQRAIENRSGDNSTDQCHDNLRFRRLVDDQLYTGGPVFDCFAGPFDATRVRVRASGWEEQQRAALAQIADAVAREITSVNVLVLENHGCVVVADNPALAYSRALNLEEASELTLRSRIVGIEPLEVPSAYREYLEGKGL